MFRSLLSLGFYPTVAALVLSISAIAPLPVLAQETDAIDIESSSGDLIDESVDGTEVIATSEVEALTAEDPRIPQDLLTILVKPLTQEQLQLEVDAWYQLLRDTATEISELEYVLHIPLEEASDSEEAEREQQIIDATLLSEEQTLIISRFNIVLDSFEAKGGDVELYRQYIHSVSGIDLTITNTTGIGLRLMTWLRSEEGGIKLGVGILKVSGILVAAIILAPRAGQLTNTLLSRFDVISTLLRGFVVTGVKRATLFVGLLLALASLGISLGPLLALVGGASFVLAFALQNNLGNFASGLMLLIYKPFDVGDRVLIPGTSDKGYVRSITLASTSFDHYTGKIVTLPNSQVWGGRIENLLPGESRLIELLFILSSYEDGRVVKDAWNRVSKAHPGILKDKWNMSIPYISPSSGTYMYWCGAWANKKGYWDVYEEVFNDLWKELRDAGVSFGINRGESYVHIVNDQIQLGGDSIRHIENIQSSVPSNGGGDPPAGFVEPDGMD